MVSFSPVIIYNTHKNVHFSDKINGKILRSSVINQQTKNPRELCYQCSKDVPDFYLEN